jgi:ectoine hydroxylase
MMPLTDEHLRSYQDRGFLLGERWFAPDEVELLRTQLPIVYADASPRRVLEKDGVAVRSVYGSHETNEVFGLLARLERLVRSAAQILGGDVYVYQFKINAKAAFVGDVWEWHQDYVFWREEDGMPAPDVVNATVFLDDVTEFNGPMIVIPGSHRYGVLPGPVRHERSEAYRGSPAWINNLTADLKYSLAPDTVASLSAELGMYAPKAPRGSVLLFHPNLVHASGPNLSAVDRNLVMVTYNRVSNRLEPRTTPRPSFLANRSCEAVACVADDALRALLALPARI